MNKWYSGQGNNSDVVLSSKIRLARNAEKIPFPCKLSNDTRKSLCKKIFAAVQNSEFAGEFDLTELNTLSDLQKISLAEKRLISPEMAKQSQYSAVLVSKDESTAIMLCEEDHIRLCTMQAGQNLKEAYEKANRIDDVFINSMKIAFSEKLGFLTSNPMHLGTGMKASFTLHLPAINAHNMIGSLSNMIGKLGFSIKPLFGDNSDFFELSNEISLGITETSAIENLNSICDQIVKQERIFREELLEYSDFEDRIFRAMGTLKMARKLSAKEFYKLISLARLGISAGKFDTPYETIGSLMYSLGTATVLCGADEKITIEESDFLRAKYVREKLGQQ